MAMEETARLRASCPFDGLSPAARSAVLRDAGMHSPNGEIRTDNDTFEVRSDVSVEDACQTSLRLARMVVAQLELLASDADLGSLHRDVVEGVACLARLACGSACLVQAALCDG